jgi:hypothetical protein
MAQRSDYYWSVDLPGLTKQGAEELLTFVADGHDIHGSAVNPDLFLTLHIDRDTAETLSKALKNEKDDPVAQSLLGVVNEWLDTIP